MAYQIGWNPVLGTQVRYNVATADAEAWMTGEAGDGSWEDVSWLYASQIGAPMDPALATAPQAPLAPVFEEPTWLPDLTEETDEKPWFDYVLPGDQDSVDDIIPDFLEPDPGDTIPGYLLDLQLPGDQDTALDIVPGVETGEGGDVVFDFVPGEGDFGLEGILAIALPIVFVMEMFGRRN